jgi:hypothetical protein
MQYLGSQNGSPKPGGRSGQASRLSQRSHDDCRPPRTPSVILGCYQYKGSYRGCMRSDHTNIRDDRRHPRANAPLSVNRLSTPVVEDNQAEVAVQLFVTSPFQNDYDNQPDDESFQPNNANTPDEDMPPSTGSCGRDSTGRFAASTAQRRQGVNGLHIHGGWRIRALPRADRDADGR